MRLDIEQLSEQAFQPFGSYLLLREPERGEKSALEYNPDLLVSVFEASTMASISLLWLDERPFKINITEKHEHTEEIIGGFPGDVIFHVALPSVKSPIKSSFRVFQLPAGGFVRFKRNVWHHAPFLLKAGRMAGIVILPPYTYTHDSVVVQLDQEIEINI